MFNKTYYTEKQAKLQQKFQKVKDTYIVDSLNSAQRLANEMTEIQNEIKEISDILQKQIEEERKDEKVKVKINKK